jgi:DNA mismatch repair protein MutS
MKVGDFYEVMGDKANAVVNALGENHHVVGRDVGLPERVPLYGVPAHRFDALLGELVEKGFDTNIQ